MSKRKTRKLVCNITGKPLFAGKAYYDKKIKKAGSEEHLHNTYICREAKALVKKGYSITDIRHVLDVVDNFEPTITDKEVKTLVNTTSLRLNTNDNSVSIIRTDPDVKEFIENILKDE